MTKKQRKMLKKIIIALSLFLIILITNIVLEKCFKEAFPNGIASIIKNDKIGWLLPFALYFAIYLYIGFSVLKKSAINIVHGQVLDENFLMAIATLGAFSLGIYTGIKTNRPEGFDEACAVILFYQIGEWFQAYAAGKSRKSIKELMDIRPDYANLKKKDGTVEAVNPSLVKEGSIIVVNPGEKIPLDGIVVEGESSLDTKALTGESLPKDVYPSSSVISGVINLSSTLVIKTTKEFENSTVSKILDLVENASNKKSKSEAFITKFAKYYTPIVVILAIALALIPPVVYGFMGNWHTWTDWVYRALSFLVVSCPCALVISVPMSFFAGLGGASKNGILIKGSIHLERFNQANIFVFDKTGTLTKGNFKISGVYPKENEKRILELARIAEANSSHPIAKSICEGHEIKNSDYILKDIPGKGICASCNDEIILCGNEKLMELYGISFDKPEAFGSIVYVAHNGKFLGYIVIEDEIKEESYEVIEYLNSIGAKTVMLTGDNENIARHVASKLHLKEFKYNLLPQNKVEEVSNLLDNKKETEYLCFIGDGINDAPVLMKSDIGLAMGGVGSDAAIEASDIVLMRDDLKDIKKAKIIAKKTIQIVYQNIIFALAVKVLILVLSALGITNMWIAVFGDVGVAILCILNAMRANVKKIK